MKDSRFAALAKVLTGHSTKVKEGDLVMVDLFDTPAEMAVELVRAVREAGGKPLVNLHMGRLTREMWLGATESQYDALAEIEMERMKRVDVYLAVRGSHNITETADVPGEKMKLVSAKMRPVVDWRVNKTRWCVLRWPTAAMAQQAGMSTEGFEDFFFRVCTADYGRMAPGMEALQNRLQATDRVRIVGPGTELSFSIKSIPAVCCGGTHNIPDGEVFTAPVRDSVEGVVSYNAPTIYQGTSFDQVRLEFAQGKIVKATASDTKRINEILDSDDGARHIGEFALGFNPHILHPMRDILFDEKISGSFHFTPGQAYESTDNGNRSSVHWDLVCIQRPDYGGGEIYFDGELVRKDGLFLPEPLRALNPENLA